MLLFQEKPDKIFTEILRGALDNAIDIVKFPEDDKDGSCFRSTFPNAMKNFSVKLAFKELENLKKYSEDPNMWKMSDYHFVLLYDALNLYCEIANDCVGEEDPVLSIGDYTVWEINFDDLINCYFRDTDFLIDKDDILNASKEAKAKVGLSKETFPITNHMIPHDDELAFECEEQGDFIPGDPKPSMFRKECEMYPDIANAEYFG
jgi:hypothetical protein